MRRFRILFLVFVVVLLAPIVLLVQRAVHSIDLERAMRHQLVAERLFDEMERSLSRFLEPQEQRPFERYTTETPPDAPQFLLGYFQVDPDGRIHTAPVRPAAPGFTTSGLIASTVEKSWRDGRVDDPDRAQPEQLPGTTVVLSKDDAIAASQTAPQAAARANEEKEVSAFDALRALNKAASERLERQRLGEDYAAGKRRKAQLDEGDVAASAPLADSAIPSDKAELAPMTGQLAEPQRLLLYRTVVQAGRAYRQGAVLDVEQLCAWIRQQALDDDLTRYATLTCTASLAPAAARGNASFSYQHRFADPFQVLTAQLALQPLPGVGSVTYVYALSALLLGTGFLGLAALYRMVSVVVRYAEQRGNFVAAVSHELKTPLTAIRMYGEMLRDGMVPSDAKRQEYYRHITGESERLTRLINNVLELSRLEKGNRQMALADGSIGDVVHEVADLLGPHLRAERFELKVEVEENLPPIRFERDALIQVLSNLVDNAVKYSRDASDRSIEMSCRAEGGRVCLTVRDHGPGVPAAQVGKIFEPFYRGENELTRRHKGTGIGLALVRGLVDRMGAQVAARNHQDGGLEVEVSWRIGTG